jgi:hypothetical protein
MDSSKLKETILNAQNMVGYYENISRNVGEGLTKTAKWKAEGHALCRRGTDILRFTNIMFKMVLFPIQNANKENLQTTY